MKDKLTKYNPISKGHTDVDEDNCTWLVENNFRTKHICGARLSDKGYVCGNEVSYSNGGKCNHHIVRRTGDAYWKRLNEKLELPINLRDLYEKAEGIGKDDLLSVTNLLRRITVLYWSVLGNPIQKTTDKDGNKVKIHTPSQLDYLRKIDTLYLQIMDSERRIENRTLVKAQFITKIMETVFGVIGRNVSPNIADIIVAQIGEVIFAFHEEGKIKGEITDIQNKIDSFQDLSEEDVEDVGSINK